MKNDNNLIWLDLEMTGLHPETDTIVEIALVATDSELNVLDKTESIAIHQSQQVIDNMNEWCVEQHGKSGLTERIRDSRITMCKAEEIALSFIKKWVAEGVSPMCGNSICQDRRFLARYMPELEGYFHYRNLDVSTLKELYQRWTSNEYKNKEALHLALDDIFDSIEELKYYREHFIKNDA